MSLCTKNSTLKLNADKTECLIIGTSTQQAKLDGFFQIHILSQSITPAASVLNIGVKFNENFNFKQHISKTSRCCFYNIMIFAVFAGLYHFLLLNHRNSSSKQHTWLLQFPPLQYRKQGYSKTSACPKWFSKGSHAFSSFFSLSAAPKIIALATCALSDHFPNLYTSLSSTLIYTTSISKFNANTSKKFQTATLNQ